MKRFTSIRIFLLLLAHCCNSQQSQITIDPDGGYTGIVIKINKDVPEDLCPQILSNTKVRIQLLVTPLGQLQAGGSTFSRQWTYQDLSSVSKT